MARINAVLNRYYDYGFEGGARYKTDVNDNPNGFEERDSDWKYGKHEYEASFGEMREEARDAIITVFHTCKGRLHDFKFWDWNDNTIDNQLIVCGTVGTTEPIQLYKVYQGFGPAFTIRPIQAIEAVTSFVDGSGNPVAGTWDLNTGIFTPLNNWGAGPYYVTCTFYVWVHLDNDYNPLTLSAWRKNETKVSCVESPIEFTATNLPESWEP